MWLRGSTDITNARQDMYDLLTGAIAAGQRGSGQSGNGNTVSGADAWTGLDATNFVIRSKAKQQPWRLPLTMWRGRPRFGLQADPGAMSVELGKPTFSGAFSGGPTRCFFICWVSTINTSAGNLTGLVVSYQVINADTGATDTGTTTVSGWTGSSDTKVIKYGVSLTLTLAGGEQFSADKVRYYRGYSTTYPQGVDYFPEGAKIDSTDTINLSTTSSGSNAYTLNTDYKLVQQGDSYPTPYLTNPNYKGSVWGGHGVFSGIEWQAGGSPPAAGTNYYVVECHCFMAYMAIGTYSFANNGTGFGISLQPIEFWDASRQLGRHPCTHGGNQLTNVPLHGDSTFQGGPRVMAFPNGIAQTGSFFINFWISIISDKLVIIVRGDPGNSGVVNAMTFQKATAISPSVDPVTWCVTASITNTNWSQANNGILVAEQFVYDTPDYGRVFPNIDITNAEVECVWGPYSTSINSVGVSSYGTMANNPVGMEGKWILAPIFMYSSRGGKDTAGAYTDANRYSGWRTKLRGLWAIANNNFSSLDELVDGGDTYLLFALSSQGIGGAQYFAVKQD